MPTNLNRFELMDMALIGAGAIFLLTAAAVISVRRQWRSVGRLPGPPTHRLQPTDLIAAMLVVFFLPSILSSIVNTFAGDATATHSRSLNSADAMTSPSQVIALTIGQSIGIAVLVGMGRTRFEGGLAAWGLNAKGLFRRIAQAAVGFVVVCPLMYALMRLSELCLNAMDVQWPRHASIVMLLDPAAPVWLRGLVTFNALVLASTAEEMLFRGLLQPALIAWTRRPWPAILLCGLLFGLIHYPYLDTIAPLAVFGVVLGYIYARTRSLTLTILVHALFNGKTLLWLWLGAPVD